MNTATHTTAFATAAPASDVTSGTEGAWSWGPQAAWSWGPQSAWSWGPQSAWSW